MFWAMVVLVVGSVLIAVYLGTLAYATWQELEGMLREHGDTHDA